MPTAFNPDTGDLLVLGGDGQWSAPQIAQNPQTGEKIYHDGEQWKPLPWRATLSDFDRQMLAHETGFDKATRAMTSGATMGFSDEAAGAGAGAGAFTRALVTGQGLGPAKDAFSQAYNETLNRERGAAREYAEQHPTLNAVFNLIGGVGGVKGAGAPAPTTLAAPTTFQTATQAAKTAGTIGAISGFGSGEGGFENRAKDAATTGTISAALGFATPYAVKGAQYGKQILENLLGAGGEEKAQRLILRAMERDGISLGDAVDRYNSGQLTGAKPEALIDLGGENTRGLMRGAANVPGPAKNMAVDFVTERQAGQPGRIASDIESAISPNTNYQGTVDDLLSARANAARPLYEQAYKEAGPIYSDRLQQFLDDPVVQKGLSNGVKIQRLEALAEGKPFNPSDLAITGFNEAGDPILSKTPNLRSLDAIKRGLDDVLEGYRDKTTGKLVLDQTGRAIDMVRKSFVNTVDELAPDSYRAARAAFAGPSKSLDAMALGKSLLNRDAEVTTKQLAGMTPGDREFVRAGLAKALRDKAASVQDGADITKRIFGNPSIRSRIQAAFDSPSQFQAFEDAMLRERAMYTNAQQINPRAGSRTAPLIEEMADVRQNPFIQFGTDVAQKGTNRAIASGLGRLYDRGRGINADTSKSIAEMLLATSPDAVHGNFAKLAGRVSSDRQLADRISQYLIQAGSLEGRATGALRK